MEQFSTPERLPEASTKQGFLLWLWEMTKVVVISLVIIIPVRMFVFQPFVVQGASMEPNFQEKEYLIIDEISQRFEPRVRGQVIVFHPPQNPDTYYIKRIIGLPGETVQFKDGQITIFNSTKPAGFVLDESAYLPSSEIDVYYQDKITLATDQYFVLGDNRRNSLDSRKIGPIPTDHIRGKVLVRAFPFSKFMIFSSPTYNF
ncbi:MAG: signal peptidase I [Candidatus Komeilibacteria bacterium]|nr:signal peptidase I [Candidatus Komeilibacteria bacterium]